MLVRLPVFLFILTGINLNQFVDNAIQDSGVKPGSHLYNLFPKMREQSMSLYTFHAPICLSPVELNVVGALTNY
jgi:hypothetical protein